MRRLAGEVDADIRLVGDIVGDELGRQQIRNDGHAGNAQFTHPQSSGITHVGFDSMNFAKNLDRLVHQVVGLWCRTQPTVTPIEQSLADILFQAVNEIGNGRLRAVEVRSGARDRARAHDFPKGAELSEIHETA